MSLRYQGHIFDSAECACCVGDAKKVLVDPTQTGRLRAKLRGTMALRWQSMRLLAREIITKHDILGLKGGGLMQIASPVILNAGTKQQAFQRWWDQALNASVLGGDGSVMRPFITAAYQAGVSYAQSTLKKHIVSGIAGHREEAIFQLAVQELEGIMAAVSQQATRAAAEGMLAKQAPMMIVRRIWSAIDKVGINRTNAMIELLVVRAHAEATLDIFEAAKITNVGLVPEARADLNVVRDHAIVDAPRKKGAGSKSYKKAPGKRTIQRIRRQELALAKRLGERVRVRTAGDDDVCPICEAISEEGPYRIDVARSLIPAHPRCRCTFVPADDARYASDQMFIFLDGAFVCDAPEIAPSMVPILERMNARLLDFNPNHVVAGEHGGEFASAQSIGSDKLSYPEATAEEKRDLRQAIKDDVAHSKFYKDYPVENVSPHVLRGDQDGVVPRVVAKYIKDPGHDFDLPYGIRFEGKVYVQDGHHRIEALLRTGSKTIRMYVRPLSRRMQEANIDAACIFIPLRDFNPNHVASGPEGGQFAQAAASAGNAGEGGRTGLILKIAKSKLSVTALTEEHQLTSGEILYLKRLRKLKAAVPA